MDISTNNNKMELFCVYDSSSSHLSFKQTRSKKEAKLTCKLPEVSKIKKLKIYANDLGITNTVNISINGQQSEHNLFTLTEKKSSFELSESQMKKIFLSEKPLIKLELVAVVKHATETKEDPMTTPTKECDQDKRVKKTSLREVTINTRSPKVRTETKEVQKPTKEEHKSVNRTLTALDDESKENSLLAKGKLAGKTIPSPNLKSKRSTEKDLKFITVSSKAVKQKKIPKTGLTVAKIVPHKTQTTVLKSQKKDQGGSVKVIDDLKLKKVSNKSETKTRDISSYFLSNTVKQSKIIIPPKQETINPDRKVVFAVSSKDEDVPTKAKEVTKRKTASSSSIKENRKTKSSSSIKEDSLKSKHETTKQDISRYCQSLDISSNEDIPVKAQNIRKRKTPLSSPTEKDNLDLKNQSAKPEGPSQIISSGDDEIPIKISRSKKKKVKTIHIADKDKDPDSDIKEHSSKIADISAASSVCNSDASKEVEEIACHQDHSTFLSSIKSDDDRKTPELTEAEQLQNLNEVTPQEPVFAALSPFPTPKMTKKRRHLENTPTPKSRRQRLAMSTLEEVTPQKSKDLAEITPVDNITLAASAVDEESKNPVARCVDLSARVPKPTPRWGHSMTFVSPTQVVLTGGQGDKQLSRDSVWSLNPETRSWKCQEVVTEGAKPEYRVGHSATFDPTMRCIYIYGGSKNTKWFHDVHMYDLDENKWSLVKYNGKAPTRAYHTATLFRHEMWVIGGVFPRPDPQPDGCDNDVHIFSPMMEGWYKPIVTGEKPRPRSGHSATCLEDRLVVFGGWDFPYCYNDLYVLDLTTVDWSSPTTQGTPPKPRSWHASCNLSYNRVFIHGGYDGDNALHDAFIFNLSNTSWQEVTIDKAPSPRAGHKALLLPATFEDVDEDEVLVFGGGDNDGTYFSDLLSFYLPFDRKSLIDY